MASGASGTSTSSGTTSTDLWSEPPAKRAYFRQNDPCESVFARKDRNYAIEKGRAMATCIWVPRRDLAWGGTGKAFNKDVKVLGVPYSQSPNQCDEIEFKASLKEPDFYKLQSIPGEKIKTLSYGSNCSSFISIAWRIDDLLTADNFLEGILGGRFLKVGLNYDPENPENLNDRDLKKAYKQLKYGDALIKVNEDGSKHIILVHKNDQKRSTVEMWEQKPPSATTSQYTYAQLATQKYMPFTKE